MGGPDINVRLTIGTPVADLAKGVKEDSRLHIRGSKGEEVVLAKGIDITQSGKKAAFYNAMGHVWTKIKNTFSKKSDEVMPRRKYVPITLRDNEQIGDTIIKGTVVY